MKSKAKGLVASALLVVSCAASSAIVYQFSFSNLTGVSGGSGADFGITLTYANYVTTTGMNLLSGGSLAGSTASLGYPVAYAGTNVDGWWGFGDDNLAVLSDAGFVFDAQSLLFRPTVATGGYFTTPGTFLGRVDGNAPTGFFGNAVLTIRDSGATVPEPTPLALLALALAGLALTRRSKS